MRFRQRGATAIGTIVILAIIGFGLYAAIRLVPLYFEYMAVARALKQTATEHENEPTTPAALRASLERRWAIEDIKNVDPKEIEIKKSSRGFTMRAWYRSEAPFIANVSLAAEFDVTVDVKQ